MLTRVLSNTESKPAFSNSLIATGVVMSLPSTMSSFALMSCPALTFGSPQWAARIFWVMVIPIAFPSVWAAKPYLLLMALTSARMPATMMSVWVPQPQVSSPLAHFSPTYPQARLSVSESSACSL